MIPQDTLKKLVAGLIGVVIFLFTLSVVLATLLYKFIMGGDVIIPQYSQSVSVITQITPTPFMQNARDVLQFRGTIKSDPEFAKEMDLPGTWYWLEFDEPYLLEENSAGIPMYIDKLAIYPIDESVNIKNDSIEMYEGKHVLERVTWGGGMQSQNYRADFNNYIAIINMPKHSKEEIEVKFYPIEIEHIRKKLKSVGAMCTQPMRLMRRIVFARENNPSLDVSYIRVRDEGNCIRISTKEYSNHEKGIKFQRELDLIVNDFDKAVALLEATGLQKTHFQESKREQWQLGDSEICIDVWPHLKSYIEIESPSETSLRSAASQLGMEWENHTNGGALLIYMKEHGWDRAEAMLHVKQLRFNEPLRRIE